MELEMNAMHAANRRGWNAISPSWQATIDGRVDWHRCHEDPSLVLHGRELDQLGHVAGRDVCVLGSGDNLVVFALSGMGAKVTSVDFSRAQLDVAARRADKLGLDIAFIQADVVDLRAMEDGRFDLVYTGGHVGVWVSDLKRYYCEACRILRRGGTLMISEYHPFRRIWQESSGRLELEHGYFERGPHVYDRSEAVPGAAPGSLPSYEFKWTVSDYVSALLDGGCELLAICEFGDQHESWEPAAMNGLPASLLLVGRKRKSPPTQR